LLLLAITLGLAGAQASPRGWPHYLHPITGKPYSKEELDRLKFLRERFSNNPLLPKELNAQEESQLRQQAEAQTAIAAKMVAGTANLSEIDAYYAFQEQYVRARMELVSFVLQEPGWNNKIRTRYDRVLRASRKQLENLARRRLQSTSLYYRRLKGEEPPVLLAAIAPRYLEVMPGDMARFEAKAVGGAQIQSLAWNLPTGQTATAPAVEFSTKSLTPGLHDVFLEATDNLGRKSLDTAAVNVKRKLPAAVDLALESVDAVEYPGDIVKDLLGKVQLHAAVRNLGREAMTGATMFFALDPSNVLEVPDVALKPGERRQISSPLLTAAQVYGRDITAAIVPPKNLTDDNLENNQRVVNFPAPAQPPISDLVGSGLRYQGPPPNLPSLPPLERSLADLVQQVIPLPIDLGPMDGFADLHNHQMADLGYDGRLLWGAYDGAGLSDAVPQCTGTNHAICWLPGPVAAALHEAEVGSHAGLGSSVLVPLFGTGYCNPPLWTGGELASTKGWHSNTTSQAFKHWPVWRTVTHQQMYRQWLEEAHNQGLNLMILSAVNFRHLCGVMLASQGFGGSHPLDAVIPDGLSPSMLALDRAIAGAGSCNDMKNVRRQLLAAWQFQNEHDWYEIALTPGHAAQIIQEGRLAVILSIEASELFDNPQTVDQMRAQLDYFVNHLGVRSIQPIHELNNVFGGTSYFDKMFDIAQTIQNAIDLASGIVGGSQTASAAAFRTALEGIVRDPATGDNTQPLTTLGLQLILDLIARGLLIDLAHMDRPGSNQTYNVAAGLNNYPLFVSHARYQDLLTTDPFDDHLARAWQTMQEVKTLGGMIGLRTGKDKARSYLRGGVSGAGVANNCPGSVRDFAQSYNYGALGYQIPQAFASDMNGFIEQMRPRFADSSHPKYNETNWACGERVSASSRSSLQQAQGSRAANGTGTDFDLTGFGHVGQFGAILTDLANLGVDTVQLEDSAESFLDMWQRAVLPFTRPAQSSCLDRRDINNGPATGGPLRPGCP
jgi:microsomal dipeptidase-like Zn-dependent dipeptidase